MSKFYDYKISDLQDSLLKNNRILRNTLNIVNKHNDNVSEEHILFAECQSNLYTAIEEHLEEFNINPATIYKITLDESIFPTLMLKGFKNPDTKYLWDRKKQLETNPKLRVEFSSWKEFIQHPALMAFLRYCEEKFPYVTVQTQRNKKEKLVEILTFRADTEVDQRLSENVKYGLVQSDKNNRNADPMLNILTLCNGRHSFRVMSNLLKLSNEKYQYGTRKCTTHSWDYPQNNVEEYKDVMKNTANIRLLLAITISSNIVNVLCGLPLNDIINYADNVPDFKKDNYSEIVRPSAITARNIINRPEKIIDAVIPSRSQNIRPTERNQIETNRNSIERNQIETNRNFIERNQIETIPEVIVDNVITNVYDLQNTIVEKVINNTSRSKDGGNCSKSNDVLNLDCNTQDEIIHVNTLANNIITSCNTQSNNLVKKIEKVIKYKLNSPDTNLQNSSTLDKLPKSPKYEILDEENNTKSSKMTELEKKKRDLDEEIRQAQKEDKEEKERQRKEREDKIEKQKIEEENRKKLEKEILKRNEEIKLNFPLKATESLTQIIDIHNVMKRKLDTCCTKIEELQSTIIELQSPNKKQKTTRTDVVSTELMWALKVEKSNNKIKELKEQLETSEKNATEYTNSTQGTIQLLNDKNRENEALISKDTETINNTILDQRKEIDQLNLELTNKKNEIEVLQTQLVEKENLVKEKEFLLMEKEKKLTENENLIKEQSKQLCENKAQIEIHESDIEELQKTLAEKQLNEEKEKNETNDSVELRPDHFNLEQFCIEIMNSFKTNSPETPEDVLQKFDSFLIEQINVYNISNRDFDEPTKNLLQEVLGQLKGEKPLWARIVAGKEVEVKGRARQGTSRVTAKKPDKAKKTEKKS